MRRHRCTRLFLFCSHNSDYTKPTLVAYTTCSPPIFPVVRFLLRLEWVKPTNYFTSPPPVHDRNEWPTGETKYKPIQTQSIVHFGPFLCISIFIPVVVSLTRILVFNERDLLLCQWRIPIKNFWYITRDNGNVWLIP